MLFTLPRSPGVARQHPGGRGPLQRGGGPRHSRSRADPAPVQELPAPAQRDARRSGQRPDRTGAASDHHGRRGRPPGHAARQREGRSPGRHAPGARDDGVGAGARAQRRGDRAGQRSAAPRRVRRDRRAQRSHRLSRPGRSITTRCASGTTWSGPRAPNDGGKQATPAQQADGGLLLAGLARGAPGQPRASTRSTTAPTTTGPAPCPCSEIAERDRDRCRAKPKRSILFVWHTGEEQGLLGSRCFTDHPTVPRDSIVAQLNMDMIGRGDATDETGRTKDGRAIHGNPNYLQLVGLAPPVDRAGRPGRDR